METTLPSFQSVPEYIYAFNPRESAVLTKTSNTLLITSGPRHKEALGGSVLAMGDVLLEA